METLLIFCIFVWLKFENKLDTVVCHIDFNSIHHDGFEFVWTFSGGKYF